MKGPTIVQTLNTTSTLKPEQFGHINFEWKLSRLPGGLS
jgi:hypothetical protein